MIQYTVVFNTVPSVNPNLKWHNQAILDWYRDCSTPLHLWARVYHFLVRSSTAFECTPFSTDLKPIWAVLKPVHVSIRISLSLPTCPNWTTTNHPVNVRPSNCKVLDAIVQRVADQRNSIKLERSCPNRFYET